MEYDYEIDAVTGRIREKDLDIENYSIPKKKATPKKQKTTNRNYSKDIGVEKAKSIALRDAGVSGVRFTKAKVDYEDGVKVYDIEFRKGNVEYEYEIDAATGSVRERSVDIDD